MSDVTGCTSRDYHRPWNRESWTDNVLNRANIPVLVTLFLTPCENLEGERSDLPPDLMHLL